MPPSTVAPDVIRGPAAFPPVTHAPLLVPVIMEDRIEFHIALVLQGYSPARAAELAETLPENDGALQMLARHRLRYSQQSA